MYIFCIMKLQPWKIDMYPLKIPQGGRECDFVAKVLWPFWPHRVTSLTSRWPEHITTKSNSQPHFFKTNFQEGAQIQLYKIPNQDEGLRFENAEISLRVFSKKLVDFVVNPICPFQTNAKGWVLKSWQLWGGVGLGQPYATTSLQNQKLWDLMAIVPLQKLQTLQIS